MFLKPILGYIALLLSFNLHVFALDAETMDGFPKGPVKEVNGYRHYQGKIVKTQQWRFDRNGNLTYAKLSFSDLNVEAYVQWNDAGNHTEATFYKNGVFHYKQTYEYDDSTIENRHSIFWIESDYGASLYQYQHSGFRIAIANYNENNELIFKETYTRDEYGNKIEQQSWRDGKITLRYKFVYYSPTQPLQEIAFNSEGDIRWRYDYVYNDAGLCVEMHYVDFEENHSTHIDFIHDSEGRITEQIMDSDGSFSNRITYEYKDDPTTTIRTEWNSSDGIEIREETVTDENGETIERIIQNSEGIVFRTAYSYDEERRIKKQDNWEDGLYKGGSEQYFDTDRTLIKETTISSSGSVNSSTVYRYDLYGNLTEVRKSSGTRTEWIYQYYETKVSDWMMH